MSGPLVAGSTKVETAPSRHGLSLAASDAAIERGKARVAKHASAATAPFRHDVPRHAGARRKSTALYWREPRGRSTPKCASGPCHRRMAWAIVAARQRGAPL